MKDMVRYTNEYKNLCRDIKRALKNAGIRPDSVKHEALYQGIMHRIETLYDSEPLLHSRSPVQLKVLPMLRRQIVRRIAPYGNDTHNVVPIDAVTQVTHEMDRLLSPENELLMANITCHVEVFNALGKDITDKGAEVTMGDALRCLQRHLYTNPYFNRTRNPLTDKKREYLNQTLRALQQETEEFNATINALSPGQRVNIALQLFDESPFLQEHELKSQLLPNGDDFLALCRQTINEAREKIARHRAESGKPITVVSPDRLTMGQLIEVDFTKRERK